MYLFLWLETWKKKCSINKASFVLLCCNHCCGQWFNINKRALSGPEPNSVKSYLPTLKAAKRILFFFHCEWVHALTDKVCCPLPPRQSRYSDFIQQGIYNYLIHCKNKGNRVFTEGDMCITLFGCCLFDKGKFQSSGLLCSLNLQCPYN